MTYVFGAIGWPDCLPPRAVSPPQLQALSRSGGRSLGGAERVVQHDAGYWRFSCSIPIHTVVQEMAWRGVEVLAHGRAMPIRLPVCESGRSPGALPDFRFPASAVTHSDGATFSDGSTYLSGIYSAQLTAPAAERATTLQIAILTSPKVLPWPGMFFTLDDRLYQVRTVTAGAGTAATITIRPPLRQAAAVSSDLNFDRPTLLARLSSDQTGGRTLDLMRFAALTIEVTEYI